MWDQVSWMGCALLYPHPTWCILLSTLYTASAFSTPFSSIHPTNPPGYYPRLLRAFIALTADVALLCGQEFAFGWRTLTPSSCSFFRQLPYFPPCVNCVCEPRNQSVALCLLACRQRPPAWSNWQRGAGRHVVAPRPMVLARACLLAGETWWHHLWQVRPCVSGVPVCKNKYVLLYWSIPDTRFSSCVQFWEKFRMCTESYVFCVHTVLKIPNNCTHHGWGKWGNRNVPNSRVIATRDIV